MPSQQVFQGQDGATYTTSNGAPHPGSPYSAQRVGPNGPLLLQGMSISGPSTHYLPDYPHTPPYNPITSPDFHLIDSLAHFDRERIPERVVHAKGAGAHGYFEVTKDISHLTCMNLFSKVGNKAKTTIRFSTVGGESGSADTARDPRGFAIKVRTEEGNWDMGAFTVGFLFYPPAPHSFPAANATAI